MAVLSLCGLFTLGAVEAFPIWDDGYVWLLLEEEGVEAIPSSHPERPLTVGLWALLAPSKEAFWRNALIVQAVSWPLLAWLSALLWRRLFPPLGRYGALVGLLTIAPFVTRVQMVTANVVLTSLPSVLLGYVGLLLALRFASSTSARGVALLVLGMAALALGILLQEYAIPVASAGTVLVLDQWRRSRGSPSRRRYLVAAASLVATTGISYWVYLRFANFGAPGARGVLNPSSFLDRQDSLENLLTVLPKSLWQGLAGGFLQSLAALGGAGAALVWMVPLGAISAALMIWGVRQRGQDQSAAIVGPGPWDWLPLLVALVAALAPPIIAGQFPWNSTDGMTSRFGLPAMPVLAMLLILLTVGALRVRFRWLPVGLLVLLASATTASDLVEAVRERQQVARLAICLEPMVEQSEGVTVAIVPATRRRLGPPRQWEVAARLAANYPEDLSKQLWAHRYGGWPRMSYREEATVVFGPREKCKRNPRRKRGVRNLRRVGSLEQLLWVEELDSGTILIESYCHAEGTRPEVRTTCPAP